MSAKAAKVDSNQPEIVAKLRDTGHTVQILSAVGQGCPDVLVGRNGYNLLMEIKSEGGKLNDRQVKWHDEWKGKAVVVRTSEEAIEAMNKYIRGKR